MKNKKQYLIDRGQYMLFRLPAQGAIVEQDTLTMQMLDYICLISTEVKKPHGF